jgi:hypothetical protein
MVVSRGRPGWRWYAIIAGTAVSILLAGLFTAAPGSASNAGPAGVHSAAASTGHVSAGHMVRAEVSSRPFAPTRAQQAARAHDMQFLASLPAAPLGPHSTKADVKRLNGRQTTLTTPQAPTDFKVFKNVTVPSTCSGCGKSTINEPDTANSGKVILQTSNWNIAYTTNGGAKSPTWSYQNPYQLAKHFCCDQTVTYVPNRDLFIYEGLTLGSGSQVGFTIAATQSRKPTSWCVYHFNASSFGDPAGNVLDYPKIAYSNNDVYVTWNEYDSTGSNWINTGLVRLPIDSLASCGSLSYSYFNRTDNFTFGLTSGNSSLDTFYWVSDWYTGGGSGSYERIYRWAENSNTYYWNDIAVGAFDFAGGSCASADGVVTNWCVRLDPRWESPWISRAEYNANSNSAFAGDTILGVAITAGPGAGDPFPYVIYEYFKLNSLAYIGTAATYNDGFAFAYPGCSANAEGYVGCVMSWGGGTGSTHYYPGGLIVLQDNISPGQPWGYSFNLHGSGNAPKGWGDYMVSQPFQPDVGPFLTTEWRVSSSGKVIPHVVIWGRAHDTSGYNRWKSS